MSRTTIDNERFMEEHDKVVRVMERHRIVAQVLLFARNLDSLHEEVAAKTARQLAHDLLNRTDEAKPG